MNARPFLFDTDFRKPRTDPAAEASARAAAEAAERAAADAYARGLEGGRAEGRAEAQGQLQARLADAMNRLALSVAGLMAQADAREAEREAQAVEVAVLLARRVAGEALDARPLAVIAEAARGALQHLRGVPHLAVRVHDSLVEETEALLRRLARERGFEGRLVVLGEPDLALGDARIEWADGGVVRERARIEAAITQALGIGLLAPESVPAPEPDFPPEPPSP
ncbi:FliH/SctL family protein [Methylobacterium radiodurans]|uniref:Flagellar assembly protein FliH n=1 Tax=Methylobacterium radiodurans TaxID=2202828 RepID=A0A2U8VU43_9HYPH|nr:FliH/SctL family protein [Methylobacterium radiodurans]AWN36948.1 flagellar assembly protein FliH [Methylobacterium radiodurans]